jgi:four helix bundle protein
LRVENEKPATRTIQERTFRFALRIVKLVDAMPDTVAGRVASRQLMRAGTSVGANVEEAQGAHSRRDFTRRMNIAYAEAREALYWLRLIREADVLSPKRLRGIIGEAEEFVRILTAIVKTSRKTRSRSPES